MIEHSLCIFILADSSLFLCKVLICCSKIHLEFLWTIFSPHPRWFVCQCNVFLSKSETCKKKYKTGLLFLVILTNIATYTQCTKNPVITGINEQNEKSFVFLANVYLVFIRKYTHNLRVSGLSCLKWNYPDQHFLKQNEWEVSILNNKYSECICVKTVHTQSLID